MGGLRCAARLLHGRCQVADGRSRVGDLQLDVLQALLCANLLEVVEVLLDGGATLEQARVAARGATR
eukprot:10006853-Alexandrium_andersonii.AAC.1